MARRRVTEAERAALQAWIDLAKIKPGAPLPEDTVSILREVAAAVHQLTLSSVSPTEAARRAATRAGLTGVAIANFRAEQKALLTTMCLEFNKHSEYRSRFDKVEHHIAEGVSNVSARQAFRRRSRVLGTKNRQ